MSYRLHPANARVRGFNMMEVLVAIGIFALGMVAVAAIFPTALILQKQTITAVEGKQAARNIKSSLKARKYTYEPTGPSGDLADYYTDANYPVDSDVKPLPTDAWNKWSGTDRGYPVKSSVLAEAPFYWAPLVADLDDDATNGVNGLTVYVFVMKREDSRTYPRNGNAYDWADRATDPVAIPSVRRYAIGSVGYDFGSGLGEFTLTGGGVEDVVGPQDKILLNTGDIFTVRSIDEGSDKVYVEGLILNASGVTHMWASPRYDKSNESPTQDVLILSEAVEAP